MKTRHSPYMLVTLLLSGATLGLAAGAALAEDVDTIQGRGSEQGAMGEPIHTSPPADVGSASGRASDSMRDTDVPRYDVTFTLMQGVRSDEKPLVDAWPGRAAAPADEDAVWKVSRQHADGPGGSHG